MEAKCNSDFGFSLNGFDFDEEIEVWIDSFYNLSESKSKKKIFVQIEPNEILKKNKEIIKNHNIFDFVLTYEEEILSKVKNAVLFEYGTKWVNVDDYKKTNKNFSISTVCGFKTITNNHRIRQKFWMNQEKILNPKNFFISQYGGVEIFPGNNILGNEKTPMFDSMFHVCIENVSKKYFFTEKLIDCFLCKSIPIYLGCQNISEYFNIDGILIASNFNELIFTCNSVSEKFYNDRLEVIEENYLKALNWIDYRERLKNKIIDLI